MKIKSCFMILEEIDIRYACMFKYIICINNIFKGSFSIY